MGQQNRRAGKSAREMGDRRLSKMIVWGIGAIIVLGVIGIVMVNPKQFGIGSLGGIALLILLVVVRNAAEGQINRKEKEVRRAYRGAKAEEQIGDMLDSLDENQYVVYHDVPSAYGNIDHVVLSRQNGVFLIETKSHGGRVQITDSGLLVNGKPPEKDFIAQALRNTYWLRDRISQITGLKVWIKPIIVFTNAFVEFGHPIKNVEITNKKFLLAKIQRGNRLSPLSEQLWAVREDIETDLYS